MNTLYWCASSRSLVAPLYALLGLHTLLIEAKLTLQRTVVDLNEVGGFLGERIAVCALRESWTRYRVVWGPGERLLVNNALSRPFHYLEDGACARGRDPNFGTRCIPIVSSFMAIAEDACVMAPAHARPDLTGVRPSASKTFASAWRTDLRGRKARD